MHFLSNSSVNMNFHTPKPKMQFSQLVKYLWSIYHTFSTVFSALLAQKKNKVAG